MPQKAALPSVTLAGKPGQVPGWFEQRGLLGGGTMAGNVPAGQPEPLDDAFFRIVGEMGGALMDPTGPILAGEDPSQMSWWRKMATVAGALLPLAGLKIVYHGTPHTFTKFDMSKIGTGEGAQAYGHGLYFAEDIGVAKTYQRELSRMKTRIVDSSGAGSDFGAASRQLATQIRYKSDVGPSKAHDIGEEVIDAIVNGEDLKSFRSWINSSDWDTPEKHAYLTALDAAEKMQLRAVGPTGATLNVELPDEAIANMLDWDKPLSQQPEAVQQIVALWPRVERSGGRYIQMPNGEHIAEESARHMYGQTLYGIISEAKLAPEKGSQFLKSSGIPGIRYLDGSSRAAGAGSYNYVTFDDELPKILGTVNPTGKQK